MRTRYQVWLNGISLDMLGEAICIHDVAEHTDGVTVLLSVRERCPALRHEVLGRICGWMRGGGYLTHTGRIGLRLAVQAQQFPVLGSEDDWNSMMTAVFAPVGGGWENEAPNILSFEGNGTGPMVIPGTADALCDVTVLNNGEVIIDNLRLEAGTSRFVFGELGLEVGETLVCTHDKSGRLRIYIKDAEGTERSAHAMRLGESDDDLLAPCGVPVGLTVFGEGDKLTTFTMRGRWL